MSDPKRLLSGEGTPFEQSLLGAVAKESPPADLKLRMEHALGISHVATPVVQAKAASVFFGKLSAGALAMAGVVAGGYWLASSVSTQPEGASALRAGDVEAAPRVAEVVAPPEVTQQGSQAAASAEQLGHGDSAASETDGTSAPNPLSGSAVERAAGESASSGSSRSAKAPRGSLAPATQKTSLREEIGLLDRARRAVEQGKRKQALALLSDYDRRFPTGNLQQEASVLRVEALEREGQLSRASAVAQEFLQQHPESPHAERVGRASRQTD